MPLFLLQLASGTSIEIAVLFLPINAFPNSANQCRQEKNSAPIVTKLQPSSVSILQIKCKVYKVLDCTAFDLLMYVEVQEIPSNLRTFYSQNQAKISFGHQFNQNLLSSKLYLYLTQFSRRGEDGSRRTSSQHTHLIEVIISKILEYYFSFIDSI